jgi:DnaK suppressor protein
MAKKNYKDIELSPKYKPKKTEEYMCPEQLAYFYQLLTTQKEEILRQSESTLNSVSSKTKESSSITGDDSDIASAEQETSFTLRMAERDKNLLLKIDQALERIENGTFGYSVISGDEIGINRMLARPLATMTIEEQEEHEKRQ